MNAIATWKESRRCAIDSGEKRAPFLTSSMSAGKIIWTNSATSSTVLFSPFEFMVSLLLDEPPLPWCREQMRMVKTITTIVGLLLIIPA